MIKRLIKLAKVLTTDDTGLFPVGILSCMGQKPIARQLQPYGFACNPVEDSLVLMFESRGNSDDRWYIGCDYSRRFNELANGECAVYNAEKGTYIHLKNDGTIYIKGDVQINGNVNVIDSDVTVTGGDVTADGISLKTHTHSAGTLPSGDTGQPN